MNQLFSVTFYFDFFRCYNWRCFWCCIRDSADRNCWIFIYKTEKVNHLNTNLTGCGLRTRKTHQHDCKTVGWDNKQEIKQTDKIILLINRRSYNIHFYEEKTNSTLQ